MKLFDKSHTAKCSGRNTLPSIAILIAFVISLLSPDFNLMAAPASSGVASTLAEADSVYQKGNYDEAVDLFKKVVAENGPTASLLYNLGNAYYKSGNEGEARLCLERAKRLDPSNDRINGNIEYLASRIQDANKAELKGKKGNVAPDAPDFFGKMKRSIAVDTASNSWAEMAAMAFILLILALALYLFSSVVKLKKIGFFSSFIFLAFCVIFIIFSEMAASQFERKDEAVLMTFKSTLLAEPENDSKTVGFPLHRGTKLQILDSELNPEGEIEWYKVKFNSSNIGWVPASSIQII